jgi:hypothetical protein
MAYASVSQFTAETASLDLDLPDDVQGLLERASQDLDQYLRIPPPIVAVGDPVPTTRLDPSTLDPWTAFSLQRACIAQAAYVCIVTPEDLLDEAHVQTVGPVTFAKEAPALVCSTALVALAAIPSLWTQASGCVPAPPPPPPPIAA